MAGKSNLTATLFAQKKLLNKAQTSILKSDAQEVIGSNIQPAGQTTFGQKIPTSPSQTLYLLQSASLDGPATVEYVQFNIESISGTSYDANSQDTGAGPEPSTTGPHGYKLLLTGNYQALSSNPKKGNGTFDNGKEIYTTIGGVQLTPPVFSNDSPNPYTIKLYKGDPNDATKEIALESEIDWQLDTFNGILFVQDYDSSNVPLFARGFIYVGEMIDGVIANITGSSGSGNGDRAAEYLVLQATGSLTQERVFTKGTGIKTTDAGAGAAFTVAVDDSIVATLTGSQFSGNVGVTGSVGVQGDLKVAQYIKHIGDTDTFIQFADDAIGITAGGEQLITISEAGQDIVKIGDGGDVDFQVRTLGDDNTLYVAGDTDRIGVGTNAPSSILHIKEAGPTLTFQRENNSNASTIDFVGALGNTGNSILHDSSTNDLVFKTFNGSSVEEIMRVGDHYGTSKRQIILLSGSGMHTGAMQPKQTSDIAFFVSGSIGSKGTTSRGAAAFGGDIIASGAIHALSGLSGSLTTLQDGTSYLRAGSNVTVTSGSNGSITIASAGGLTRAKDSYFLGSNVNAGDAVSVSSSDFSAASYDPDKIDVFINGMLMHSGSVSQVEAGDRDYYVSSSTSLKFSFQLHIDDAIDVIVFSVS